MSNGINTRQNEERSIQMLAAQREINNEIKIINCVIFGLSVMGPFTLSFINSFIKNNIVETVVYIVSIAFWAISYWINNKIKSKKNIAATIQQQFDSYVYSFGFNNGIDNIDINASIIEKSEKHFTKDINNKNKLLNWYNPIIDELPLNEAIIACQKTNYRWDIKLRKRYRMLNLIIAISIIAIIITFGVGLKDDIFKLIWRFSFILPVATYFTNTYFSLKKDIERLEEIKTKISEKRSKFKTGMVNVQNLIYDHRINCTSIPNFLYSKYKNIDEDNTEKTIIYENNK